MSRKNLTAALSVSAGLTLFLGFALTGAPAFATGVASGGHSDTYVFYNDWSGEIDHEVTLGSATDQVFSGDFDGSGRDWLATRSGSKITIYRDGTDSALKSFLFWDTADVVFSGDFDGDRTTTFGVRQPDTWYLRNEFGNGNPDATFDMGTFEDLILVGDVLGKGSDAVVARKGNEFQVRYANGTTKTFAFGTGADVGVVALGDWDGDGTDTPLVRSGNVYLAYNSWDFNAEPIHRVTIGSSINAVLVGDWDGDGKDTLALRNFNFKPASGQTTTAMTTALEYYPDMRLRADAAESWQRVQEIFGKVFQINSAWRSYDSQVSIFESRYTPKAKGGGEFCDVRNWNGTRYVRTSELGSAAVPGTSNHGAGLSIDVNGFEGFDDPVRLQLLALAKDFGWSDKEGCSVNERWHLTYNPANDKGKSDWSASDPIKRSASNCPDKKLTSTGTAVGGPTCTP